MKRALIFAILLALSMRGKISGQANGPAPQNQPPGVIPLLVGGQFNTTPAAIAPGNMTPLQLDANGNLKINLQAGSMTGAGTSATDSTGFTAGSSAFTAAGGVFNDSLATISPAAWGAFRMTAFRALHENLRDSSGNEYNQFNPLPVTLVVGNTVPGAQTVPVTISGTTAASPPVNVNLAQVNSLNVNGNALPVVLVTPSSGLPLQPCNQVRVTGCQHF